MRVILILDSNLLLMLSKDLASMGLSSKTTLGERMRKKPPLLIRFTFQDHTYARWADQ